MKIIKVENKCLIVFVKREELLHLTRFSTEDVVKDVFVENIEYYRTQDAYSFLDEISFEKYLSTKIPLKVVDTDFQDGILSVLIG